MKNTDNLMCVISSCFSLSSYNIYMYIDVCYLLFYLHLKQQQASSDAFLHKT
jgi:hypothetical protein